MVGGPNEGGGLSVDVFANFCPGIQRDTSSAAYFASLSSANLLRKGFSVQLNLVTRAYMRYVSKARLGTEAICHRKILNQGTKQQSGQLVQTGLRT